MAISKEDLCPPPFELNKLLSFDGEGVIDLLIECEKYIFAITDGVSIERRVRFFLYDLDHVFQSHHPSAIDLVNYLLKDRKLNVTRDAQADVRLFRLSTLCHRRQGSQTLVTLLLSHLLAKYQVAFVHFMFEGHILIRTSKSGTNNFIDFSRDDFFLNADSLLQNMNQVASSNINLESILPISIFTQYLRNLKLQLQIQGYGPEYLRVLNLLITSGAEGFSSTELLERGMFFDKIDHRREALKDLKRYFNFCKAPEENPKVYQTYQKLLAQMDQELL